MTAVAISISTKNAPNSASYPFKTKILESEVLGGIKMAASAIFILQKPRSLAIYELRLSSEELGGTVVPS